MRRIIFLLTAFFLLLMPTANSEESSDWSLSPVIIKAYELSAEKLYLEWQGNAPVYQVYVDGESAASVIVNHAVIPLKKGSHTVSVYPINEVKSADTKINVGFNADANGLGAGGNINIDLAALGLDPKKISAGTPSAPLFIDYTVDPIFHATPDKLFAQTDFDDRVLLSFVDRYNADEYLITVKTNNDVNYVRFNNNAESAGLYISKTNSTVTLTLDQEFLQKQGCMIPELNEKYTFSVQLRKYATNILNGEKETTAIHESKVSSSYDYILTAPWKAAPVITYASQTSDGQITIKWDHDDNGIGCEYTILKIKKAFGIKVGAEVWGTTSEKEFVVNDLLNGVYSIAVRPQYKGENGDTSNEIWLEIKNDWVIAPALSCEQIERNQVKLSWLGSPNVETYHITVYTGNSESLLRFVDLDYSKYTEFDLPAENSEMTYIFINDKDYDQEAGLKLKFEIYSIRHAANGTEQKSATSSQTIIIK